MLRLRLSLDLVLRFFKGICGFFFKNIIWENFDFVVLVKIL